MRLYAVVSFTSGERVACRWYPQFVHSSLPFSVGRASGCCLTAGAISFPTTSLYTFTLVCL
jgi:hypothetical protein